MDVWQGLNPFASGPEKQSNKLKPFVGKLPANCLSVFDLFEGFALKWLNTFTWILTRWDITKKLEQLEQLE